MRGEIVRAALLGLGAWARVLATAAAGAPGLRISHCWGRNAQRLDAFAREFGLVACQSLESILDDPDIDAVLIALPNDLHYPFARRAAEAGKHVYLEKPIAQTLLDGLRVAELERAQGIRVAVGHCARLLAGNRILHERLRAGDLGQVNLIEGTFSNDRGLRLTPADWRFYQASAPGGPLSQIAIHQFDTLRYLGGEIASVSAIAARRSPVGAEVEDEWLVHLRFASGALGQVTTSWTSPGIYRVQVSGDAAQLCYEVDQALWGRPERLHEGATLYRQPRGGGPREREPLAVPAGNMFREELALFARSVLDGTACELSADNGCHALAVVVAAGESAAAAGRAVELSDVFARARQSVDGVPAALAGSHPARLETSA